MVSNHTLLVQQLKQDSLQRSQRLHRVSNHTLLVQQLKQRFNATNAAPIRGFKSYIAGSATETNANGCDGKVHLRVSNHTLLVQQLKP